VEDRRAFPRGLELHQEVGAFGTRARVVQYPSQDRRGEGERDVPERTPRLWGKGCLQEVALYNLDVRMPGQLSTQPTGQLRIKLDGGQSPRGVGEWPGESSGAGADLDDVVVGRDAGIVDELSSYQPASQEVLIVRP